jgi:quinol monooxygenase YgiN
MTTIVILDIQSKESEIDNLLSLFKKDLSDTRAYEGCLEILISINQADPLNIILHEKWKSKEHYDRYLNWRKKTGSFNQLTSFLSTPPKIHFHNILEI